MSNNRSKKLKVPNKASDQEQLNSDKQPRIRGSIASAMVSFALSKGMSLEKIEEVTGLSGLDFVDPHSRHSEQLVPKLWVALTDMHPNETLPLELARAAPLTFFGGLADGCQFAADLRAALNFMIKNGPVMADSLMAGMDDFGNETHLYVTHPMDDFDLGRGAEVGIALMSRLVSEIMLVSDFIIRVEFVHSAIGPLENYEEFFEAPVKFQCPRNMIVIKPEKTGEKISKANIELFKYIDVHFQQELNRIVGSPQSGALRRIKRAIAENAASGEFSVEMVAARLNLSVRSAQRLATNQGTPLSQLIEDFRRERALEFVADFSMNFETVAELLGYSDDRAFRRAFKRWTGNSPAEYRRNAH